VAITCKHIDEMVTYENQRIANRYRDKLKIEENVKR